MDPLAAALAAKVEEQIERTVHLMGLVADPQWTPPIEGAWRVGEVMGHLLDCLAGFCAVFYRAYPERLAHFAALRDLPVNGCCAAAEAIGRVEPYRAAIAEGFGVLRDADLTRPVPTVFVAEGEAILTLLLGNLEHLINHKHQLFTYLKLVPVAVGTGDLYRRRR